MARSHRSGSFWQRARPWLAVLPLALAGAAPLGAQPLELRVLELGGVDPALEALRVANAGAGTALVELVSFNGKAVFHGSAELHAEIDALAPEVDGSLATRIFRFVADNHEHADPLTERFAWLLVPARFFNASGLGMCGQVSDLMQLLASERGIPARVWVLNGHVVSELWSDGGWRMYDADYGVFFLNRAGFVASVAELEADPTLITDPVLRMPTRYPAYTASYAELYISTENFIRSSVEATGPTRRVRFSLPSGASLRFPGHFALAPPDRSGGPAWAYQDLALRWPAGATGALESPLIVHTIRGAGTVDLAGRSFAIGSARLQAGIASAAPAACGLGPELVPALLALQAAFAAARRKTSA